MDNILNEKKKFIRHVLSNSPPGKINDLISDLKTLFGSSENIIKYIEEIVSKYNEDNYKLIPIEDNEYVITCKHSKRDDSYIHPKLKLLASVNHLDKQVIEKTALNELNYPEQLEQYRKICSDKLSEYVQRHYSKWSKIQTRNYPSVNIKSKSGLSVKCYSSVYASEHDDKFNLFFVICCDRYYLKNFHASSWRSSWNVSFLTTDKDVHLKGTIDITLTYFEDANINLKTTKNFDKNVQVDNDIDTFATNIISVIKECENATVYDLNNFIINISEKLIKNTRRIIPFNGEKFNWKDTYEDFSNQIKLL
ncbi:F-actin-capping protein subunit alpha, putative [Hepatocystis sp. ex Piliocolobus tephrosceles]|nr:F-actin-capping protein subunit alpha, putative [Hepatocystis sp. ex Piliocolobus tephrosceles]